MARFHSRIRFFIAERRPGEDDGEDVAEVDSDLIAASAFRREYNLRLFGL